MDEKIEYWRRVMKYAKDRGIDIYFITWNVLMNSVEGKYSIRACFYAALFHSGKVDTEKGKVRIRYWVDEIFYKMFFLFPELIILATEWDNQNTGVIATHFGNFIRVKSSAINH